MRVPRVVVVLGAGEIGSGWAALFAAYGSDVRVVDPNPAAIEHARESLGIARSFLPRSPLGASMPAAPGTGIALEHESDGGLPPTPGSITAAPIAEALEGAEWIQESLPERIDLKRNALAALEGHLSPGAIVASSTSTLTASVLAEGFYFAPRLVVAHPLNPVYAVPIVELSAGTFTKPEVMDRAAEVIRALEHEPVIIRGEPPGLVANRLTAALLREALELVTNGVIDPAGIDRVVARGIATGWTAMGPFATEMIGRQGAASASISERTWAELIIRILDVATHRFTPDAPSSETSSPRFDSQ